MNDETDWILVDFDKPEKPAPKNDCPKCGKKLGKGGHFHIKACHGPAAETR